MNRLLWVCMGAALILGAAGCGGQRTPATPHASYTQRQHERIAYAGADTTRITLSYPEFVAAATPEALDSLRATVRRLSLAGLGAGPDSESDTTAVLDGFIQSWQETRAKVGGSSPWFLNRRIDMVDDTLGIVTLRFSEAGYMGGAHPNSAVLYTNVDATSGRTLRFGDLFRESARDSLSAALEPLFRSLKQIAPDSSLKEAGYWFEDGHFHVNDNLGVGPDGVTVFFNSYEIAPYSMGQTNLIVPFDVVRPFVRPDGPLGVLLRAMA